MRFYFLLPLVYIKTWRRRRSPAISQTHKIQNCQNEALEKLLSSFVFTIRRLPLFISCIFYFFSSQFAIIFLGLLELYVARSRVFCFSDNLCVLTGFIYHRRCEMFNAWISFSVFPVSWLSGNFHLRLLCFSDRINV